MTPAQKHEIYMSLIAVVRTVCSGIEGVTAGVFEDKTTWKLQLSPTVSDAERAASQVILDGFDIAIP